MIIPVDTASHPYSNREPLMSMYDGRTNTRVRDRILTEHLELESQKNKPSGGSRGSICAVVPLLKLIS